MKTFLAFSFQDEDRDLARNVEALIASQNIGVLTGKKPVGGGVAPEVQGRINESNTLVGLLTRREALLNGGWSTHQWVLDEIAWARARGKPTIAMIEEGVRTDGMFAANQRIDLDRQHPLDAFLTLSETLGQWRQAIGRSVKVQIAPSAIAQRIGKEELSLEFRLWLKGQYTEWRGIAAVPEPGGTFVHIDGVQDDHLIQLRAKHQRRVWQSHATSQWLLVQLNEDDQ